MVQWINNPRGYATPIMLCVSGGGSPLKMEEQTEIYKKARKDVSSVEGGIFGGHYH